MDLNSFSSYSVFRNSSLNLKGATTITFNSCIYSFHDSQSSQSSIEISISNSRYKWNAFLPLTKQGYNLQVVLPSGTRIKVIREFYGMNVYLYAAGDDESPTPGLCGNFNGNQNEEFLRGKDNEPTNGDSTTFARSWK